jgi:hypothetical protein
MQFLYNVPCYGMRSAYVLRQVQRTVSSGHVGLLGNGNLVEGLVEGLVKLMECAGLRGGDSL